MNDEQQDYILGRVPPEQAAEILDLWKQVELLLTFRAGYEWWDRAAEQREDPWFVKWGLHRKVYIGIRFSNDLYPGVTFPPFIRVEVESDADDRPRAWGMLNVGSLEYLLDALEWRIDQPDRP